MAILYVRNLKECIVINAQNIRKVLNLFLFKDIIIKQFLFLQSVINVMKLKNIALFNDFYEHFLPYYLDLKL